MKLIMKSKDATAQQEQREVYLTPRSFPGAALDVSMCRH